MPYKDKEKRRAYDLKRAKINDKFFDDLRSKPCLDCGLEYPPYIMEFDHVPERGKKLFNITSVRYTCLPTSPKLQTELDKCDVVCANCHKLRTHKRRKGIKL